MNTLSIELLKEISAANDGFLGRGEGKAMADELIAIRELKGDQVPVDTGIFTRDELISVCEDRMRDMPEDYAPYQIAKIALSSLFTAPQKPVVLPKEIEPWEVIDILDPTANPEDYACCVGADMYNAAIKACRRSVQAAGCIIYTSDDRLMQDMSGIVKDGE